MANTSQQFAHHYIFSMECVSASNSAAKILPHKRRNYLEAKLLRQENGGGKQEAAVLYLEQSRTACLIVAEVKRLSNKQIQSFRSSFATIVNL
jgi:hypothetical protein